MAGLPPLFEGVLRVDQVRIGSLGIWEHYLPYAVTLGVADQMLKQLELQIPPCSRGSPLRVPLVDLPQLVWGASREPHDQQSGKVLTSATLPQG